MTPIPQPGDILFVRGRLTSPVDDAIKLGEFILEKREHVKDKHPPPLYTHVCVYLGGNKVVEAQGLRKSGTSNIGDYTGDYDVGRVQMTYDQNKQFLEALQDEEGLPYDWVGIFWLVVFILTGYEHPYRERRRRYCSKFIGWALAQVGIIVNDETPESLAGDKHVVLERG